MRTRFKLGKLFTDRGYSASAIKRISQVCKPYEDKDAIAEKLIALIEPCKTEQEALEKIGQYYPISE